MDTARNNLLLWPPSQVPAKMEMGLDSGIRVGLFFSFMRLNFVSVKKSLAKKKPLEGCRSEPYPKVKHG
jgi:hypothetical protein